MQFAIIFLLVSICAVNASVININFYGEDHEVSHTVDDCNFQACDQLCRNLGFPGGACVGDRCDCDNFKHLENLFKTSQSLSECYPLECDQSCRRIGFPGGVCVNGRCKCDIIGHKRSHQADKLSACDPVRCEEICYQINHASGMCSDENCECY